jgi:hypothetical protein
VVYRVEASDEVAGLVATFYAPERYAWNRACREIAANPYCRMGHIVERVFGIAPTPTRNLAFTIACKEYASGETVYFFSGQSLPGRTIAYVIDEDEGVVEVIFVRTR